jgi:hypothetical protein
MDEYNREVMDYYFLPNLSASRVRVSLGSRGGAVRMHFSATSLVPLRVAFQRMRQGHEFPVTPDEFRTIVAESRRSSVSGNSSQTNVNPEPSPFQGKV